MDFYLKKFKENKVESRISSVTSQLIRLRFRSDNDCLHSNDHPDDSDDVNKGRRMKYENAHYPTEE